MRTRLSSLGHKAFTGTNWCLKMVQGSYNLDLMLVMKNVVT